VRGRTKCLVTDPKGNGEFGFLLNALPPLGLRVYREQNSPFPVEGGGYNEVFAAIFTTKLG